MILLTVDNVHKHYGPDPVLSGVTFDIRSGERLSIVGPNGAGKSTLLRILMGQEEGEKGDIRLANNATIGWLEQHVEFAADETIWQVAETALADLVCLAAESEELAHRLAAAADDAQRQRLEQRFDVVQAELHRRDGYNLTHKIERVLQGLGFQKTDFARPATQLSGGQQNRLLLARLLLQQPTIMLLDEPTNHLDIEATEWLENFLVESTQTLILVSHDRYLLDRVASRTLELVHGQLDSFPGNYSAYQQQKAERLEVQRRTYEKQQEEIEKLKDFIRRHHHGQKHAQAEDRRKKLERIEPVPPPREIAAPAMGFPEASHTGEIVLRVEGLAKAYEHRLFSDLAFDVLRGEKWGILGPNGVGKTTLLRCITGEVTPDAGQVNLGTGVRLGYSDQMLTRLDADAQVVDAIRPAHKEFVEQQRRDLLARFGIVEEMVFQKISSLSGGERNRSALAMVAATDPNFLVLDEPTNHLDLWARASLEKSLKRFDGTILLVSHDRYFLNQVVDHVLVVQPDRHYVVEGNYDAYLTRLKTLAADEGGMEEANNAKAAGKGTGGGKKNRKQEKEEKPTKRRRRFPYRKADEIEVEIGEVEEQIGEVHAMMADPVVLRNGERVKELTGELEELDERLALLYEHWEESNELNG